MLGRQLRTCGCNGVIPVSRSSASVEFMGLWVIRPFGLQLARKSILCRSMLYKKGLFPSIPDVIAKIPKTRPFQGRRQGGKSGRQGALGVTATPTLAWLQANYCWENKTALLTKTLLCPYWRGNAMKRELEWVSMHVSMKWDSTEGGHRSSGFIIQRVGGTQGNLKSPRDTIGRMARALRSSQTSVLSQRSGGLWPCI